MLPNFGFIIILYIKKICHYNQIRVEDEGEGAFWTRTRFQSFEAL